MRTPTRVSTYALRALITSPGCLRPNLTVRASCPRLLRVSGGRRPPKRTAGDTGAKAKFNSRIGYALYEAFGFVPVCVSHTKEYLRYWQGLGKTADDVPPLSHLGNRRPLSAARRDVAAARKRLPAVKSLSPST